MSRLTLFFWRRTFVSFWKCPFSTKVSIFGVHVDSVVTVLLHCYNVKGTVDYMETSGYRCVLIKPYF